MLSRQPSLFNFASIFRQSVLKIAGSIWFNKDKSPVSIALAKH